MLSVGIKVDMRQAQRSLTGLKVDLPKVTSRALNDGAGGRGMMGKIKRPLQQLMGLKTQAKVKQSLSLIRSTPQNLTSSTRSRSDSSVNLRNFKGFRVTNKKGVFANVMGKVRHVPDGFDTNKYGRNVLTFKRTGPKAKPIVKLTGPGIPKAMLKSVIVNHAHAVGIETFNKRFAHYVRQALRRRGFL